MSIFIV